MTGSSYRTILRSSSMIGGAQAVNILASLVRMKASAVLLGAAGVGLVGLYGSLIQTAAAVASLGLATVGTRQIASAAAEGGDNAVGSARHTLFWSTCVLALIGGGTVWLLRGRIADLILSDPSKTADVGWLALGVVLVVAAGSQTALLTGLRRVGDLSWINVASGVLSAGLGVLILRVWGAQGLIAMVLTAPMLTLVLGHFYVARLGPPAGPDPRILDMLRQGAVMAKLGLAVTLTNLLTMPVHLAVRALVQRDLGTEALGQFQASWAISVTYLGLILGAMGTDYYPRLTAVITDHPTATRLVNEQTEVALLLFAPVLLAILGLAPFIIRLLYTADFDLAVAILRWQLLGDLLKVLSWPLGFVLLAIGTGKKYILAETLPYLLFLATVWAGLPLFGVEGTGIAFLAMYAAYLPLVWWLGGRRIGFRWTVAVRLQTIGIGGAALVVDGVGNWSTPAGAAIGIFLAAAAGLWAIVRLSARTEAGGRLGQVAALAERVRRWTIGRRDHGR